MELSKSGTERAEMSHGTGPQTQTTRPASMSLIRRPRITMRCRESGVRTVLPRSARWRDGNHLPAVNHAVRVPRTPYLALSTTCSTAAESSAHLKPDTKIDVGYPRTQNRLMCRAVHVPSTRRVQLSSRLSWVHGPGRRDCAALTCISS